jgi:prolyl 3-hydroxylase /prolyl 3,4-dihydroxylase
MAKTHSRSPSPEPKSAGQKRPKIEHESSATSSIAVAAAAPSAGAPEQEPAASPEDVIACFAPDLLDADNVDSLTTSYAEGEPFKHALVGKLFRDEFLQKVKDECLSELHFTEKETDIYKVRLFFLFLSFPPGFLFFLHVNFLFLFRSTRQAI